MRGKQFWSNIGLSVFVGASLLAACSSDGEVDASGTTSTIDEAADPSVGSELDESAASDSDSSESADDATATTAASDASTTTAPPATVPPTTAVQAPANSSSLLLFANGAAGGWAGNRWFTGDWNDDVGSLVNWEGEDVAVITIDGVQAGSVAGQAGEACDPLGSFGLATQPGLGYTGGDSPGGYPEIGILSDWNPVPRTWDVLDSPPEVYLDVVKELLSSRGLDPNDAVLDQVVRVDLEGDGVDEILISANDTWDFTIQPDESSYSLVLLRKVIEGEVQTAILFFEAGGEPDSYYFPRSRIAGLADLNGDAKMEILTQDDYYEGSAVVAWEYLNDDLGPVKILSTGCGV